MGHVSHAVLAPSLLNYLPLRGLSRNFHEYENDIQRSMKLENLDSVRRSLDILPGKKALRSMTPPSITQQQQSTPLNHFHYCFPNHSCSAHATKAERLFRAKSRSLQCSCFRELHWLRRNTMRANSESYFPPHFTCSPTTAAKSLFIKGSQHTADYILQAKHLKIRVHELATYRSRRLCRPSERIPNR